MEITKEKLDELHLSIPGDYYDYSMEYNPIKKYFHETRFKVITNMAANAKGKLLDIGCAGGTFTNELSMNTDAKITAIDISPQAIEYAQDRYPHIDFRVHDASFQLPFADNSFDTITILETLEHVLNPVEILQDMKRVLKPDGEIVVLVPSENWYFQLGWMIWTKLPFNIGGNAWEEVHVQRFDGDKLRHLLEFIGYEVIEERRPALGLLVAIRAQVKDVNLNI